MPKIDVLDFDDDFESDESQSFEKIRKVKHTEEEIKGSKKKDSPKHKEKVELPEIVPLPFIPIPKKKRP